MLRFAILILLVATGDTVVRGRDASSGPADGLGIAQVFEFRIEAGPAAVERLGRRHPSYSEVTVSEGGVTMKQVGARLKGHGSFQKLEKKPGFTLKFNEFSEGQRFRGLRKIHLNNSVQDETYLCRYLGSRAFLRAGLPAAQVGFARVHLNGRDLGLYVLEEGITKDFLDAHFGDHTGTLYEGSAADVDRTLEVDNGDPDGDQADLKTLFAATQEVDPDMRLARLNGLLDLDRFYTFMALEVGMRHWDGYCNFRTNYRLYHDPKEGRFVFIPHGMDSLFKRPEVPINTRMRGVVGQAVLATPEGWRGFMRRMEKVSNEFVNPAQVIGDIEAAMALIGPVVEELGQQKAHSEAVQRLKRNVGVRHGSVGAQLRACLASETPVIYDPSARTQPPPREEAAVANVAPRDDELFGQLQMLSLKIELSEEAIESLRTQSRRWVKATVREGTTVYSEVGVHLKGVGSFKPIDDKPSWTLKFNQFVKGQRLRGLKKLTLEHKFHERSYVSEYVGNRLFRDAGVPAPRVGFAEVTLNDRKLGMYVMIEGMTRDFLGRYFKEDNGNFYEGEEQDLDGELDQDGGEDKSGEDLRALVAAAREPDPGKRMERLGQVLDLDRFLSFLAMEQLAVHVDGYGLRQNNYRLYADRESGFVFIPDGLDYLFGNPYAPVDGPLKGLLAAAVLETGEGRKRYLDRMTQMNAKVLLPSAIESWMSDVATLIGPSLGEELAQRQKKAADNLMRRIEQRREHVKKRLWELMPELPGSAVSFDAHLR